MNKTIKTIFTAAGLTAGAAWGLHRALGKLCIDFITAKKMPAAAGLFKSGKRSGKALPAEHYLDQIETEKVEIVAHDGLKLVGHLQRAEKPKRIIIAVHGWRASWRINFRYVGEFLHDQGCTVLYIDQRSHGESEGEYKALGLSERKDCLAWLDWVNSQNADHLPIYFYGFSMGATTVLMTSGYGARLKRVKGIIADSGFTSPKAIMTHVLKRNLKMEYRWFDKYFAKEFHRRTGEPIDSYSTLTAMESNTLPILFIHGEADDFVPTRMTLANYNVCTAEKTLVLVPGAGHCLSSAEDPEMYKDALRTFFKQNDRTWFK